MVKSSPEHVIPRSVGGHAWTIAVHPGCNRRANKAIDGLLPQCGHIRHARAEVGVTDPRSGAPYEEQLLGTTMLMTRPTPGSEVDIADSAELVEVFKGGTDYGGIGARVQVSKGRGNDIRARFVGNPVLAADGTVDRFVSDDQADAQEDDSFEPFTVLCLVEASRQCWHGPDMWARFTAKVGLGLISLLSTSEEEFEDGAPVRASIGSDAYDRLGQHLRRLAFGPSGGQFPDHPYRTATPERPMAEHMVGVADVEGHAVLIVRLFGYLNYRLEFVDVAVDHDVAMTIPVPRVAP